MYSPVVMFEVVLPLVFFVLLVRFVVFVLEFLKVSVHLGSLVVRLVTVSSKILEKRVFSHCHTRPGKGDTVEL